MGKQQASPPPAVDYGAQAQAQGQANVDASRIGAQLNRVNQFTPYGSLVYTPGQSPDQWDATISLSPEQQSLLDKQTQGENTLAETANSGLNRVQSSFSQPFDPSQAPARVSSVNTPSYDMYTGNTNVPNSTVNTSGVAPRQTADYLRDLDFSSLGSVPGMNDFGTQKDEVRDTLYRQQTAQLDPQFAQAEEQMRARLANSGITPGSEAFNQEMANFARQRTDAYGDARDRSLLAAGAEQSRLNADSLASRGQMMSQILTGGQFKNQAADQANTYGLTSRAADLDEIYQKAGFENDMAQQNFDNQLTAMGFNNTSRAQGLADAIAAGNFQNQARGASLDEQAFMRSLPLNEYNALISGAQVTNPSFANTPGVASPAPAPMFAGAEAQNQSAMDLYNQQVATNNSNTQAGIGLAGTLASAAAIF
jgi:hypothetical protein